MSTPEPGVDVELKLTGKGVHPEVLGKSKLAVGTHHTVMFCVEVSLSPFPSVTIN